MSALFYFYLISREWSVIFEMKVSMYFTPTCIVETKKLQTLVYLGYMTNTFAALYLQSTYPGIQGKVSEDIKNTCIVNTYNLYKYLIQ